MKQKAYRLHACGRAWRCGSALAVALLLLFPAALPVAQADGGSGTYGFFGGDGTNYAVGNTLNVVLEETGTDVSTVQANFTYPTSLLQFQGSSLGADFDPSISGATCPVDSAGAGTVSIACTVPTAYNDTELIAQFQFTVLASGTATVSMVAGPSGNPTDIEDSSGNSIWDGALATTTYSLNVTADSNDEGIDGSVKSGPTGIASTGGSSAGGSSPSGGTTPQGATGGSQSPSPAAAGSIAITVTGSDNKPVKGAKVGLGGGRVGHTDAGGHVNFGSVSDGMYSLVVTAAGQTTLHAEVMVSAGAAEKISLQLSDSPLPSPIVGYSALGIVVLIAAAYGFRRLSLRRQVHIKPEYPVEGIVIGSGNTPAEQIDAAPEPAAGPIAPASMPQPTVITPTSLPPEDKPPGQE